MKPPSPIASGFKAPRRRLTREDRLRQLVDVAWQVVGQEGTDALTLGRLAERAGVTKPVVYDHFGTRNGLLAALYQDYDARQTALMDQAIAEVAPALAPRARVIASCYVDCVLTQGREIPGVLAALAGSPELGALKRQYQLAFIDKCRAILGPFAGHGPFAGRALDAAGFWAMLGAADGVSDAAAAGEITPDDAKDALFRIIIAMVGGDAGEGGDHDRA
ncbi:TetR family transcriptional regulator [Tistrella bauzanensis]|uniref:TetR family transcriptional regulator n=1 Tax=Tistrella bauzanensis TaxID=657419 RepID=A0ABQ1JB69_9PROT|nr:TetR/AcrR family transcriptional regulator [Tistrella bauzanensis]GGB62686.1 TetR family transcriptional regulator [Tistrella bauzanensis]